jgi:hypothetical protein
MPPDIPEPVQVRQHHFMVAENEVMLSFRDRAQAEAFTDWLFEGHGWDLFLAWVAQQTE